MRKHSIGDGAGLTGWVRRVYRGDNQTEQHHDSPRLANECGARVFQQVEHFLQVVGGAELVRVDQWVGETHESRGDGGLHADTETLRLLGEPAPGVGLRPVTTPTAANRMGEQHATRPPRGDGGGVAAGRAPRAGRGSYPCYTETSLSPAETSKKPGILTIERYADGLHGGHIARLNSKAANTELDSWYGVLDEDAKRAENNRRARRLTSQRIRRRIRHGDLRRLLTFTNGAEGIGWANGHEALRIVASYLRGHVHLFGDTAIVLVAERGTRNGRWHVHAAIRNGYWLDYSAIIRTWSDWMESHGWHSETGTHRFHAGDEHGKHKHGFTSARTCAGYMTGYLKKGLDEPSWLPSQKRTDSIGSYIPEPRRIAGLSLEDAAQFAHDTFMCTLVPFTDYDGVIAGYWFEEDG